MLIKFLISLFGHLLISHSITRIAEEFAFPHRMIRLFELGNLFLIAVLLFLPSSSVMLWLLIGILLISLKFFPPILRFFLLRSLRRSLIPFFDAIILSLHAGRSFRTAVAEAIEMQTPWVKIQLHEMMMSIMKTETAINVKSALLKALQEEFAEIDRSKSRCLEQMMALRREYKMIEEFRRRSVQVTHQTRLQAIIVTALYAGLLSFVIVQFGFKDHRTVIFLSLLLFAGGLIWIFLMGKRLKWKV